MLRLEYCSVSIGHVDPVKGRQETSEVFRVLEENANWIGQILTRVSAARRYRRKNRESKRMGR